MGELLTVNEKLLDFGFIFRYFTETVDFDEGLAHLVF